MTTTIFILILVAGLCLFIYQTFWKDKLIRARPFPEAWVDILNRTLPVYTALPHDQQQRLQQLIHLFLARKSFYGCAGLELNDEIRVTIAGQACLLLLNKGWHTYPKLLSVLVYPSAFRAERDEVFQSPSFSMLEVAPLLPMNNLILMHMLPMILYTSLTILETFASLCKFKFILL